MTSRVKHRDVFHDLRKYVREYNEVTGIHGLRYLTEKRSRMEKLFWAIVVVVCLAGCVYMIYEIVKKYNTRPVVVSFATEHTPIYQIPFPSVTICPESKFSSEKFNYTDVYFKMMSNESELLDKTAVKHYSYIHLLCDDEGEFRGGNKTVDSEEFFATICEMAPNITMGCYFEGTYSDNCETLFTPIIIDQGLCYSFNILDRSKIFRDHVPRYKDFYHVDRDSEHFSAEGYDNEAGVHTYPRRALMSGADSSFDIYLRYNSNDTDYLCSSFLQGFRILIHTPWDVPHLSNYYFRVPLDKTVVAAVDPELIVTSEEVKKFRAEIRKCYTMDERPLKHFKIYTQSHCLFECLTNYTLEKCGCVGYFMPRDNSTPICGSQSYNCTQLAESELRIKDLERKVGRDETYCDCKPSCTDLKYHIETSHSDFYWREYYKARMRHGMRREPDFSDEIHWSVLSIYLKDEQFRTLERNELYGVSDFISNFGGLLGLFTGFSIMSLIEIIYFLSLRLFYNTRLYAHWSGPPD